MGAGVPMGATQGRNSAAWRDPRSLLGHLRDRKDTVDLLSGEDNRNLQADENLRPGGPLGVPTPAGGRLGVRR